MQNLNNSQQKVLVVEDDKTIARVMELKLQKVGIDAKAVFNGKDGLKELENGNYDLALLDIMMPILDGWNVLKRIKEKGIKTKVIITSNLSQEEDKKRALEMGAVEYLIKSDSTLSYIVDEVKRLLG